MAKELVNLCPEKNVYASDEARKISDKQQESVNFERTPLLNPDLRWICPAQENFASEMKINGVDRVSKRIWFAGFNSDGIVASVRSISVASLRAMALGLVKDGIAAPVISTTVNAEGATRTAPGTQYIHAMNDTTWIKGENHLYVVKTPVAIKSAGSAEVYVPHFSEGKMQTIDGKVALETNNMKFFELLSAPTDAEVAAAKEAIIASVGEHFYAL